MGWACGRQGGVRGVERVDDRGVGGSARETPPAREGWTASEAIAAPASVVTRPGYTVVDYGCGWPPTAGLYTGCPFAPVGSPVCPPSPCCDLSLTLSSRCCCYCYVTAARVYERPPSLHPGGFPSAGSRLRPESSSTWRTTSTTARWCGGGSRRQPRRATRPGGMSLGGAGMEALGGGRGGARQTGGGEGATVQRGVGGEYAAVGGPLRRPT